MRKRIGEYIRFAAIMTVCIFTVVLLLYCFGNYIADIISMYVSFDVNEIFDDKTETKGFEDDSIEKNYSAGDYHKVYIGEIVKVYSK